MQHKNDIINPPSQSTTASYAFAYLRLWQIIGDKKRGIEPLLPVSRSAFYAGIKSGKYPAPIKLSERTSAWRKSDILALLESFGLSTGDVRSIAGGD